jgi:hypothetical protein
MWPKVCISILNYKNYADTIECLETIFRLDYPNFQVVVVDNPTSPPNDSLKIIQKWAEDTQSFEIKMPKELRYLQDPPLPKTIKTAFFNQDEFLTYQNTDTDIQLFLVQANENRGYSAGNNIALKFVLNNDFDYAWILNNDTVVEKDSLKALVEHYERHKDSGLGILGGKVRYYQKPDTLQCAAGATYNKYLAYGKQVGNKQKDVGQFDNQYFKFDLVIGACTFVSRSFLQKVGLLSEDYFLYFEEQDWAYRCKKEGFHLGYTHKAIIYHKEGSTVGGNQLAVNSISALSDFYYARSKIIFTKKYYKGFCLLTVYLSFLLIILNRVRRKQFSRIPMLLKILLNPKKKYENK